MGSSATDGTAAAGTTAEASGARGTAAGRGNPPRGARGTTGADGRRARHGTAAPRAGLGRRRFAALAAGAAGAVSASGLLGAAPAARAAAPGRRADAQLRGLWIASVDNIDWPSKPGLTAAQQRAELVDRYELARRDRLNTVVVQVRPTADAFWPSAHEPWSAWLTGVQGRSPGYDPLAFAVTEAHRRGLRFHAWMNPYRITLSGGPDTLAPTHPARRHPEWTVVYGGRTYYNPGLPQVRRFVREAMLDAVRRYDVDGLHWDDYFYPYPVAGEEFDDDAAYRRYGRGHASRADWRRANIDRLVLETVLRVRAVKPHVRFGISPFGVWRNAATDPAGSATTAGVQTYDDLYADTRGWVRRGWLDYIAPQLYWNIGLAAADYAVLVPWWSDVCRRTGTDLYIGEAVYKAGDPAQPAAWQDPAELSRHLDLCARHPEVRGNLYFSAKDVQRDRIGAMARLVRDHYRDRVPAR